MAKKWIQNARPKKGALHRQLGIPQDKPIPTSLLRNIQRTPVGRPVIHHPSIKATTLLKRRANLALTMRRF